MVKFIQFRKRYMPLPLVQKKRSNFWYLLPLVFAIFGGVIAYFVLRKTDPSKARNCLLIGIGMVFVGIIINVASLLSDLDPEIGERRIIEQQAIRDEYEQRTGEKIELVPAGSFDWESEKESENRVVEQGTMNFDQIGESESITKEFPMGEVDENNILINRPYWTFQEIWKEWEFNNKISTTDDCLALVNHLNYGDPKTGVDPLVDGTQDKIFNSWTLQCVFPNLDKEDVEYAKKFWAEQ